MISTNYYFNYYNALKITISFLLIGILAKSFVKPPSVLLEFILLASLLFISLIYAAKNYKIESTSCLFFIFFLLYILSHTITASLIRPFTADVSFFQVLQFNMLEFRLSTISYFLPILFFPLAQNNIEKFETYFVYILKISIAYTFFEQFFSLIGYRTFFEHLYSNSGIVTENQIGAKSFGLYRIWGLVGSPQLLGVFHLMTIFFMLHRREHLWAFLSVIAVILSTSKTAYLILFIVSILYIIHLKRYALALLTLIILSLITILSFNFYFFLIDSMTADSYPAFTNFIGSIIGYETLLFNVEEESAPGLFISGGPLITLVSYFMQNPLEIILGKGLTYSFTQEFIVQSELSNYLYLTSDFYILSFFEQYGVVGILILSYIFLIYPLIKIFHKKNVIYFIPIVFFLSMFHYPPHIPKLIMLLASYPLWKLYFYGNK